MHNPFFKHTPLMALLMAGGMIFASSVSFAAHVADDGDDGSTTSAVPDNVTQLTGKVIDYAGYKSYVTTGRPEDRSKMFLLYNVGTGKFLNVGSYWGTQAVVSDVPRPFWLQRRNEEKVGGQWSYLRYPESTTDNAGWFYNDFFNLTTMEVGNTEGALRAHATYNYIRMVEIATNKVVYLDDAKYSGTFISNGESFKSKFSNVDFSKYRIEAQFDMSACTGTSSTSGQMETLLSFGENVDYWDVNGVRQNNLHIYGFRQNGKSYLRVQAMEKNGYEDAINKTGDSKHPIDVGSDNLVTVVIDWQSILVNGVQCMPRNASPYESAITPLLGLSTLYVGSAQGDTRTKAVYKSVTLNVEDPTRVVSDGYVCKGRAFSKEYAGNLSDKEIYADIDLSTCSNTNVNENILSIGTDISNWFTKNDDTSQNLHIYYNGNSKKVSVEGVNNNHPGGSQPTIKATVSVTGTVKVKLNSNGLYINDALVSNFDASNDVIKYLVGSADKIQVGSREGDNRSYATYNKLTVTSATLFSSEASVTKVFEDKVCDGQTVKSAPLTLNFTDGDCIEADIDLSQCDTKYENVFSIGTDITKWGNESTNLHNIHFYWLEKTDGKHLLQVVYVNKDHSDDTKRAVYVADGELLHVNLSKDGLFVGGTNIYPSLSPMPQLAYDASRAGDIVRIKQDSYGNRLLDENGRYIIDDDGHGVYVTNNGYIYTEESRTDKSMPLFITSRFNQESTASGNEDVYFSWAPFLKNNNRWGTVGVFADRALPQKEVGTENSIKCSQWYFEPVSTADGNYVYRIYLNMKDVQVQQRSTDDNGKYGFVTQSGKFYLQATTDQVYGNNLENYGGGYNDTPTELDLTAVKAIQADNVPTDAKSYWKVFDMNEYYRLFKATNSEMSKMLNLSFLLSDPNFDRESSKLSDWTMDDSMKSAADNLKVRIGYDHYSKKHLTDTDYTDNSGLNGKDAAVSKQFNTVKARTNNHGRYMGVDVSGDGHGQMWQDVELEYPGWYAVSCSGLTTAGAKLFVQTVQDDKVLGEAITQPLHALAEDELNWLKATDHKWPYDQVNYNSSDADDAMPMYNALVAMNDDYVPEGRPAGLNMDGLKAQVSYFVDPELVAKGNKVKIRFGISIPNAAAGTQTQSGDDASAMEPWTVFDNFHLMFGGRSHEPNLVLDEDSTTLDYLDKANHQFSSRPMRLKRTLSDDKWSTIILPVNLTKSQLQYMFGDNVKLAKLDHLTDNTIEFVSETESSDGAESDQILLHAFKPYIMRVSGSDKKSTVDSVYVAEYYDRTNGGKTSYKVKAPAGHYYVEGVTLQGVQKDKNLQPYYNFKADDKSVVYTEGMPSYTYADDVVATNEDNSSDKRTLQAYGTLCKNFSGKSIIAGRSDLKGAYVLYGNNMNKIKSQYGTKGLRCWFVPGENDKPISALAKVMIDGVEDTTTSISDIYDDGTPAAKRFADGVYTMDGRLLRSGTSTAGLPAGLYIVGGQKVVVK